MVGKTPHAPPGPGKSKHKVDKTPIDNPLPAPRSVAHLFEDGAPPPPLAETPISDPVGPAMGVEEAAGVPIVAPAAPAPAAKGYVLPEEQPAAAPAPKPKAKPKADAAPEVEPASAS
ncbi:hypothetical protein [Hyphomicrobium sp.]|uniref:hypothetical protein n=1 Tax=Hyphomicrobium sp. TaxID=82 RepID=UPI001D766DBA|nr:hypothetical protein [Hyphomicrobium sp.]MBY0559886.1 hypothetical protein [Hyphomicrobium sp.]